MSANHSTAPVEYRHLSYVDGYRFLSDGRVQSCWEGHGPASHKADRWHDLTLRLGKGRKYLRVCVKRHGKRVKADLHPLMCEAWHGPAPAGLECRHIDDNPLNNRPDNLRWGSRFENMADRQRNGIQVQGSQQWKAELDEAKAREIRRRYAMGNVTYAQLADEFGVAMQTIYCVVKGLTWKHVI